MQRLSQYFKEVMQELQKVSWPTRQQTQEKTLLVIGVSLAIGLYLGLLDFAFSSILSFFIN